MPNITPHAGALGSAARHPDHSVSDPDASYHQWADTFRLSFHVFGCLFKALLRGRVSGAVSGWGDLLCGGSQHAKQHPSCAGGHRPDNYKNFRAAMEKAYMVDTRRPKTGGEKTPLIIGVRLRKEEVGAEDEDQDAFVPLMDEDCQV